MNEIAVYTEPSKTIDFQYDVFVRENELVGIFNSTEIKKLEEEKLALEEDSFEIEFDENVSKADRKDYLIAASCGTLTGGLSILWGKEFSLDEAHKWGNEKADNVVKAVAKSFGYKKDDLDGAIEFLEKRFPMAGDALTNEFGGGKQHHLRDFSHHPTPLGLICSIAMQFTETGLGTDTQGNIIHVKITKDGFIGETFADKILFGTINWFFHLISDFDGSSSSVLEGVGKGTGIPGPILATLKELSALPIFKAIDEDNKVKPKVFSEYISKLFNGTLIKNENGEGIRFDLRTEMGIGHFIVDQSKPVVINECVVRACYLVTRFIDEVNAKEVKSFADLDKLEARNFLPFNNRSLNRMITVASGVFVAINVSGTAIKSVIKSKGNKAAFYKEFFLSVNYVGIGRFAFACAADMDYIKDDIKGIYEKYVQDKENLKANQFKFGYKFLSLSEHQTRLMYSLKSLSVEYDIENTKNAKEKLIKKEWLKNWKAATLKSFELDNADFFMDEEKVYSELYMIDAEEKNKGWLYLLTMELLLFQAYYPLNDGDKELYKGLKYKDDYLYNVYVEKQKLVNKKDLKDIEKTYSSYISKLKDTGKKVAIATAATVAVTVASGGLALAFAPEIAVVLAGESVAGLSGAALTSASLATIGGGSLAAGGLGMAGGTAILTGGGALIGLAGTSSASLVTVLSQTSEKFTLNECAKLLTFCKLVVIEKYNKPEMMNPIIAGIETCINEIEEELANIDTRTKEGKTSIKRIKSSLKYLKNCARELIGLAMSKNQGNIKLIDKAESILKIEKKDV